MSTLKVDTILKRTGTGTITVGQSGDTITIPSGATLSNQGTTVPTAFGKIGQVVQNIITSGNASTSSSSYQSTSHTVTITPTATSSKVLVEFNIGAGTQTNGVAVSFAIYRASTQITQSQGVFQNAGGQVTAGQTMRFLDSPSTTSATTYTVYFKNNQASGLVNVYGESNAYGYAQAMEVLA